MRQRLAHLVGVRFGHAVAVAYVHGVDEPERHDLRDGVAGVFAVWQPVGVPLAVGHGVCIWEFYGLRQSQRVAVAERHALSNGVRLWVAVGIALGFAVGLAVRLRDGLAVLHRLGLAQRQPYVDKLALAVLQRHGLVESYDIPERLGVGHREPLEQRYLHHQRQCLDHAIAQRDAL